MDRDLAIEALVQAIPHVGGPLATLYFGNKRQKEFERLQSFYKELQKDLEEVKSSISPISEHSENELVSLVEEINDRIENERSETKRKYYRNLFKNSLIHPVKNNFNERKYFIDVISNLSEPHFQILSYLKKTNNKVSLQNINITGIDKYLVKGFVNQLENYGLINLEIANIQGMVGNVEVNKNASLSELGKEFHYFCISD